MAFIECRDLHFSYSGESGEVLHGVDLDIEKGSFVALLGHNGCGKSTMAKLFNGMLVPTSGTVTVDGIDTAATMHRISSPAVRSSASQLRVLSRWKPCALCLMSRPPCWTRAADRRLWIPFGI